MTVKTDTARTVEPETVDERPRTASETLGVPELTHNQHGHARLIDNPAPLSSLLHLPVLVKDDASSG